MASLFDKLLNLLGNARNTRRGPDRRVRPASEDPYGDPADQRSTPASPRVKPASQDPYGDPADRGL